MPTVNDLYTSVIHDYTSQSSIVTEDLARNNPANRGWVSHTDAAIIQGAPLVVATTDTKLVLGTLTSVTAYGPRDADRAVVDLWDNTNDMIQPLSAVGQLYRVSIKGTMENTAATSGDEALEFALTETGGADLLRDVRVVNQASGTDMFFNFEATFPADAGNIANGVEIYFKALGGNAINVFDVTLLIEAA